MKFLLGKLAGKKTKKKKKKLRDKLSKSLRYGIFPHEHPLIQILKKISEGGNGRHSYKYFND